MPPPDSSTIDAALVAKLRADAYLATACPDGVFMDEATQNATRYLVVSVLSAIDIAVFQQRGIEDITYQIVAVMLATAGSEADIGRVAYYLDVLLEDGTLDVPDYSLMHMHRQERIRQIEVDDEDPSSRWFHRGGHYRVQMALASEGVQR